MIGLLQPEVGRQLAGHPITRGLVMAVNFAAQSFDSLAGSVTVPIPEDTGVAGPGRWARGNVSYATGVNRYGNWVGFNNANTNSFLEWQRSDFVPTTAVSILMLYEKADSTNRNCLAGSVDYGLGSNTNSCNHHVPFSDGVVYFDWGGNTNGVTRVQVGGLTFSADRWVFTVGSRGMEIWQNGIKQASNGATPTRNKDATMPFKLGASIAGSGTLCDIAHWNVYAMWDRQLTTTEIVMVSADPYILWDLPSPFTLTLTQALVPGSANAGGTRPVYRLYPQRWG
jgi:hypothetical protein